MDEAMAPLLRAIAVLQTRVQELERRGSSHALPTPRPTVAWLDAATAATTSFILDPRLDGNRRRVRSFVVLAALLVFVVGTLLGNMMFGGG
jgi:hypothetical protein